MSEKIIDKPQKFCVSSSSIKINLFKQVLENNHQNLSTIVNFLMWIYISENIYDDEHLDVIKEMFKDDIETAKIKA